MGGGTGQSGLKVRALNPMSAEDAALSAYVPSLEAAYRVGSPVVNEIVRNWAKYAEHTPAVQ